jgi:hypothetical protein
MAEKSKFWHLKNINIFDGMEDAQMKMVEKMTTMCRVLFNIHTSRENGARVCALRSLPPVLATIFCLGGH